MAPRRFLDIPAPVSSLRSSLAPAVHPVIDSILKDLKLYTRRLQVAFSSHQAELRVLERLHYKGSNQHRTALFWRRVSDVRRCGRRVDETELPVLIERLRLSFWGEPVQQNPKILKSPWTHVPDIKTTRSLLQRLTEYRLLIKHSQDRMTLAHDHFNLDLQTGAFLQLILVLTAVASRLHILFEELGLCIDKAIDTLVRLLRALDPDQATVLLTSSPSASVGSRDGEVSKLPLDPRLHAGEDLGEASVYRDSSVPLWATPNMLEDTTETPSLQTPDFMFTFKAKDTETIVHTTVVQRKEEAGSERAQMPSRAENRKQKIPKKKRKKDEIDDIFGF